MPATPKGRQAMIPAEALASMLIAWTLPRILARSRSTTREVGERLREVAARLLLDVDHDREEVHLGGGHPLEQPRDRLAQRQAERLRLDDRP